MKKFTSLVTLTVILLLITQQSRAFTVKLEINNLTNKTITTPGIVEMEKRGEDITRYVPQLNKVSLPHATQVAIDYPQTDLDWWGLISLLVYDVRGNLLVPCLEDTYWGVSKDKTFVVTITQHGQQHPYYTCEHN